MLHIFKLNSNYYSAFDTGSYTNDRHPVQFSYDVVAWGAYRPNPAPQSLGCKAPNYSARELFNNGFCSVRMCAFLDKRDSVGFGDTNTTPNMRHILGLHKQSISCFGAQLLKTTEHAFKANVHGNQATGMHSNARPQRQIETENRGRCPTL